MTACSLDAAGAQAQRPAGHCGNAYILRDAAGNSFPPPVARQNYRGGECRIEVVAGTDGDSTAIQPRHVRRAARRWCARCSPRTNSVREPERTSQHVQSCDESCLHQLLEVMSSVDDMRSCLL